jgi:aryl-alcohol dehydrogenase-like predicted oxidoreductase
LLKKSTQRLDARAIVDRLRRGAYVTEEEIEQLRLQIAAFEERALRHKRAEVAGPDSVFAGEPLGMIRGHVTREGGVRFAINSGKTSDSGFYRGAQDMLLSSVGIGTYRGALNAETDAAYATAVHAALEVGVNLIDTSLNYRRQRSERAVAAGIRRFVNRSSGRRDEITVCTKGGYVLPEAVTVGTLGTDGAVGGTHSMAPAFLADQIDRSRRNLGLDTIDVYYIHNPETQLRFVKMPEFMSRVRAAFEGLEHAVSKGFIRYFGTATWNGYRDGLLSLRALVEAARDVAGDNHHFRFVQLPFNLGMQEARMHPVEDDGWSVLDVAAELEITVIASASLFQARLARDLPVEIAQEMPGLVTDAQRAIHFARSTPGIACTLVGMCSPAHVVENLAVATIPPMTLPEYRRFCSTTSRLVYCEH